MKNKIWFKAKKYGYGWYPSSWEGWLTLLIYIALLFLNFYRIDSQSHSASDSALSFVPETLILTIILIIICVKKGEPAAWHWGDKK